MTTADQKAMKRSYRELIAVITAVVNEWDPDGLIGGGAPKDEYEREVAQIAAGAAGITTAAALAAVISRVFSDNFAPEQFPVEACMPVATRLFAELEAKSLLGQAVTRGAAAEEGER